MLETCSENLDMHFNTVNTGNHNKTTAQRLGLPIAQLRIVETVMKLSRVICPDRTDLI